jgi:DNA-binding transcriptional regulator YdaS (Cro superfamily)
MDTEIFAEHPIDRAARLMNITLEGLGGHLGVSKGAVSQWKLPGRITPAEHCPKIERLTGGRVRCEELNAKVDWAYLREAVGCDEPITIGVQERQVQMAGGSR